MTTLTEEERQQLDELMGKRDSLNRDANRLRDDRDRMNMQTKSWSQKRDELNAQVRELVEKANGHRAHRDEQNAQVRAAKEERDKLNKAASEAKTRFDELRKSSQTSEGPSVSRLKKQMNQLEFEQQTKVLSSKKEREIVEKLQEMAHEIRELEKRFEQNQELKGAWETYRQARDSAEAAHAKVQEFAELAQRDHDAMVSLFEDADRLRKEADGAQVEFVKSKVGADDVHQRYIDLVNQCRDLDKVVVSIRSKERKARRDEVVAEAKAEAEEVYKRFLGGDKLSTEDLLVLQKAGLL